MKQNLIQDKSFDFALKTIRLYVVLCNSKEYVLSKQLLKSGTSIGANVEEALAAQSTRDFISKLSIATKEARETKYWLRLLEKSELVKFDYTDYIKDADEVLNILYAIIKTTQKKIINKLAIFTFSILIMLIAVNFF